MLKLRAFHEGGQVNIEITDDGAGLNGERIRQKAIERGLVPAQQAARISDRDVFNMIFLPGFSTAEKVTNVSGRGVGMDVVKTNVEKIGGTVDVQSTAGKGTTVKIKIPLTLAIIPALMVTSGGERFAIPQVSLLELVRMEAGESGKGIEMVHGAPVYRLRGRLLPLVYLNRELHLATDTTKAQTASAANIVVVQADGREFGLVVDEITDTEEIVVKPMGKQLKGISAYSGATIMGDGRVALILDILGLAQRAQVISEARESALEKEKAGRKEEGVHRPSDAARGPMRRSRPHGHPSVAGCPPGRVPSHRNRTGRDAGSHAVPRSDHAPDPPLPHCFRDSPGSGPCRHRRAPASGGLFRGWPKRRLGR